MSPKTTPMAPMSCGTRGLLSLHKRRARILRPRSAAIRDFSGTLARMLRGIARNFAHRTIGGRFRTCIVVRFGGATAARVAHRRLPAWPASAVEPFTPGFVADSGLANQLAEIGVILLMFGVGLHFLDQGPDVGAVHRAARRASRRSSTATAIGVGMAHLLGWSFGHRPRVRTCRCRSPAPWCCCALEDAMRCNPRKARSPSAG